MNGTCQMTSMTFPMMKLTNRPQNRSGCELMKSGPTEMPLTVRADNMTAMIGSAGMPSVRVGTNPV